MKNNGNQKKREILLTVSLIVLSIFLVSAFTFIAGQFIELKASVEYERSVFISQIAKQMKNNVIASRKNHLENTRNFAIILDETQPETFEEVQRLFPDYAGSEAVNRLFFLSSDCELYGIDGVKQWVSLPYEEYFLDALFDEYTTDFIRIGINQEFMVYSVRLPFSCRDRRP